MNTFISNIKIAALLCGISGFSVLALAGEMKDTGTSGAGQNKIEIKDFAFNPQTITVKSGDKITWINRDEEPHTVVSVGKKFQRSSGLDTRSEEHTSELQSPCNLVCRLLLEKKKRLHIL